MWYALVFYSNGKHYGRIISSPTGRKQIISAGVVDKRLRSKLYAEQIKVARPVLCYLQGFARDTEYVYTTNEPKKLLKR